MNNFADTFSGKLWLLIIDKIIIGAIIAIALFIYDHYKTIDIRNYQKQQVEIQLQFERSRLVKDFLPVIQDQKIDLVTRGYVLRSAVLTKSLDADVAFEIGQDFLRSGLSQNHYYNIVSAMLPSSISAFARRGVQISKEWFDSLGNFPNLDTIINPLSGIEQLPPDESAFIIEGRLLRDVLHENLTAFDGCVCPELSDDKQIPDHLFGLFTLLQTSNLQKADELSLRPEKALQLLGMVFRLWQRGQEDHDAEDYLENEFGGAASSEARMRRARVLIAILSWLSAKEKGFGSPAFASLLSNVAVGQFPHVSLDSDEEGSVYWLRWHAAEALFLAKSGATDAVPTIVGFLKAFQEELSSAKDRDQLETISTRYQSGKIVRTLVSVLGNVSTEESKQSLQALLSQDEDRLRYFPFLKADLEYALGLKN